MTDGVPLEDYAVERTALTEEDAEAKHICCVHKAGVSYNGTLIEIYQCKTNNKALLLEITGFGHVLALEYIVNDVRVNLDILVQLVFKDFCTFMTADRKATGATLH